MSICVSVMTHLVNMFWVVTSTETPRTKRDTPWDGEREPISYLHCDLHTDGSCMMAVLGSGISNPLGGPGPDETGLLLSAEHQ